MATYAIVKTGGKQYKVAEGDIVKVEKIDSVPGSSVSLPVAFTQNLPPTLGVPHAYS